MKLTSVFENNEKIPKEYTCLGKNINPPLFIEDIPEDVVSLALIMNDPDAPKGFVHWVLWNIAPVEGIEEDSVPEDAVQGLNGAGENFYTGPCPPSGVHRYFFKIYALDSMIDLDEESGKDDLEKAMKGHIIDEDELIGLFSK